MRLRHLFVVLKLTRSCNLNCTYCYEGIHSPLFMAEDVAIKCIDQVTEISDHVVFTLHGGEPLLAGKEFFRKLLAAEQRKRTPHQVIINHIQTNGTLIDEEWIDIFQGYGIGVGISLDGPLPVHDRHRLFASGQGTFETIHDNIEAMKSRGIELNCLAVITKESLRAVSTIFQFYQTGPFRNIDFLPCVNRNGDRSAKRSDGTLSPLEYAEFMNAFFDLWVGSGKPFGVRTFDDILQMMMGHESDTCVFLYPKACGHQVIAINVNGDVYPCDKFIGIERMRMGNIAHEPLQELLGNTRTRELLAAANALPKRCTRCHFVKFCYGACLYHRRLRASSGDRESYYCRSNRMMFRHIQKWISTSGGVNACKIVSGL